MNLPASSGHRARLRRGSSAGIPSGSPLLELQPRQAGAWGHPKTSKMTVFFVNRNENENEFVLAGTKKPTLWGCTIYFHFFQLVRVEMVKWWHLPPKNLMACSCFPFEKG